MSSTPTLKISNVADLNVLARYLGIDSATMRQGVLDMMRDRFMDNFELSFTVAVEDCEEATLFEGVYSPFFENASHQKITFAQTKEPLEALREHRTLEAQEDALHYCIEDIQQPPVVSATLECTDKPSIGLFFDQAGLSFQDAFKTVLRKNSRIKAIRLLRDEYYRVHNVQLGLAEAKHYVDSWFVR